MNVWLVAALSIDGKIAQTEGQSSLDWTSKEDLRFFIEKTKEAGVLVMGRKTFDTIGKALPGREIVVMTRTPEESEKIEGVVFTNKHPNEIVDEYKTKGQQSIVIAGGSSVYSEFIREGLVTDYFLTVEPVIFGNGVSLASGFDRVNLHLVETKKLGEQAVLFHYRAT